MVELFAKIVNGHRRDLPGVVLVSLLLTLNIFRNLL